MNPRHVPADCRATCRRQSRQYPHNLVPATALDQRLDAVHNVLLHFLVLGSSLPPGGKNNEIEEIGAKAPQFACRLPARLRSAFLTLSIPAAHRAPHGQYVPFGANAANLLARPQAPPRPLRPRRPIKSRDDLIEFLRIGRRPHQRGHQFYRLIVPRDRLDLPERVARLREPRL
jgi:hypothetical protein